MPHVVGFVWPRARGNCIPFLGVVVPGGLLASAQAVGSAGWAVYERVNNVAVTQVAASASQISGTVSGLPTDADARPLSALLYGVNAAGQVSGPLAGCAQSSLVALQTNGNTGTFTIPCAGACAAAADLVIVIVASVTPLCADDAVC